MGEGHLRPAAVAGRGQGRDTGAGEKRKNFVLGHLFCKWGRDIMGIEIRQYLMRREEYG